MKGDPTQTEIDFILTKARKMLDHATGARYCDCVTDHGAASGFRRERDPDCQKCDNRSGLISNPPWDGNPETAEPLITHIKAGQCGGTAYVERGDRVGKGGKSSWFQVTAKGMKLTRGDWQKPERDVLMTWAEIVKALATTDQLEMAL